MRLLLSVNANFSNFCQDNVLISSSGSPLLSDFGISRVIVTSHVTADTTSFKGSIRWIAIECVTPPDGYSLFRPVIANEKTDVWAFGMTVYVSLVIDSVYLNYNGLHAGSTNGRPTI
jgi:serine/threonine protein kinase